MLRQYGLQDHHRLLLLAIGASRGRGVPQPLDAILEVHFEPTTNRMFMASDGLGNHGNALTAIREQDRQATFRKVGGTDAARFFPHLALLGRQVNTDHGLSFQRMAAGIVIDSYKCHESTDTKPFLQLFPSRRLSHWGVGCRRALLYHVWTVIKAIILSSGPLPDIVTG